MGTLRKVESSPAVRPLCRENKMYCLLRAVTLAEALHAAPLLYVNLPTKLILSYEVLRKCKVNMTDFLKILSFTCHCFQQSSIMIYRIHITKGEKLCGECLAF
jgi:hypothetical protein